VHLHSKGAEYTLLNLIFSYGRLIETYFLHTRAVNFFSKKPHDNQWPDNYGPPPNRPNTNWLLSDAELANRLSSNYNDTRRGPGSPNNKAKKWFNMQRKKRNK
jgi:hypothetical protein